MAVLLCSQYFLLFLKFFFIQACGFSLFRYLNLYIRPYFYHIKKVFWLCQVFDWILIWIHIFLLQIRIWIQVTIGHWPILYRSKTQHLGIVEVYKYRYIREIWWWIPATWQNCPVFWSRSAVVQKPVFWQTLVEFAYTGYKTWARHYMLNIIYWLN